MSQPDEAGGPRADTPPDPCEGNEPVDRTGAPKTRTSVPEDLDRPLKGIGLVLLSSVFSSVSDTAAKLLASEIHGVEVVWLRYIGFVAIMLGVVAANRSPRLFVPRRPGLQLARALLIITSAVLFILGLHFLPVAEATTTFYIAPVFVTALSIVFLGEQVGVRRWIATIVGLIGVFIVVRPGSEAFNQAALYPLGSAVFWAGSLVVTRKMSRLENGTTTLLYTAIIGLITLSVLLPFVWIRPSWPQIALGAFISVVATAGQGVIIFAYRYAGASLLAPFSYAQIIWAAVLGYLVFGDVPSVWVFVGGAVIIGSGLYTAHRERVRLREAVLAKA